ncbi:hypothetical protein B0O99DRAFT_598002 [Bisporella sp. PMI_857]|nr:hypothetical protein B0O99DRAFT_598002 [Bisporella sp. PMI_857]
MTSDLQAAYTLEEELPISQGGTMEIPPPSQLSNVEVLPVLVKDPDTDPSIEEKTIPEDLVAQTSPKTPTTTLDTFRIFSNLPQEIQDQIWSCALEQEGEHRVVALEDETRRVRPTVQLASPHLAASQDSRAIARARYPKRLLVWSNPGPNQRNMGSVYLNLERDTCILGLIPLSTSECLSLEDEWDDAEYAGEIEYGLYDYGIAFHTGRLARGEYAGLPTSGSLIGTIWTSLLLAAGAANTMA